MANRRYDQFPAGVYTATDIILQADPVTGALEKIQLQDIPSGSQSASIYSSFATTSNVAATPTDIFSFSLPANTLAADGDYIECEYNFLLTNSEVHTLQWSFAGNVTSLFSASNTGASRFYVKFMRISSTQIRIQNWAANGNSMNPQGINDLIGQDFTIANIIKITMTAATAGSIVGRMATMKYYPAA